MKKLNLHATRLLTHSPQNAFKNYTYRKVISKGAHQIDGKTYNVKEDLYDVVPKDNSKYELKISEKTNYQLNTIDNLLKGAYS